MGKIPLDELEKEIIQGGKIPNPNITKQEDGTIKIVTSDRYIYEIKEDGKVEYTGNKGIIGNGDNNGGSSSNVGEDKKNVTVNDLKAGDYIKYDSGKNGVITCRVLYPTSSEYGLQIISDESVKNVKLGNDGNFESAKVTYNNAIVTLNTEAEKYINSDYAYDARCVGSKPTVANGMFTEKNTDTPGPVTLQFAYNGSKSIDCKNTDNNYVTDETHMKAAGLWATKGEYFLATHYTYSDSGMLLLYYYCVYEDWNDPVVKDVGYVYASGESGGYGVEKGFRPCISLKSNAIKIISGDGKSADSAYVVGK